MIWRQRGNQVRIAWLPDGWEGSDPPMERRGIKEFLYGLYDGTSTFSSKMVLPEFANENAPVSIIQHLISLLYTSLWKRKVQRIVPLHSRRTIANVPLHSSNCTISLHCILCGFTRCYHALNLLCE